MASAASRRVTSPVVVGRHDEMATVRQAIEGIAVGRPHVVIIGGEGAAGKTRLVDEALAWAGDDR